MNVSLITSVPMVPPWDQGDKNLAFNLATALPHIRFQVLTAHGSAGPPGENLIGHPVFRSRHPDLVDKARVYAWMLRRSQSRRAGSATAHNPPDLYHLVYHPFFASSMALKWLPELRRRPTLHTVPATATGNPLSGHLFFADRLVALSQAGKQALLALGLKNVHHIPAGIEARRWAALGERSEDLKARLGFAGMPVVLYPGHYSPGYGARVLVKALPAIAARVPQVRVIFACRRRSASDRQRETEVRQDVRRMGLEGAVRYYDTVSEMGDLIGASDLVLLPFENMREKVDIPTTLLEALAAGKPVVISDIPPMNEIMDGHVLNGDSAGYGRLVTPGDMDSLAGTILCLLEDPDLRERMGRSGQELIRQRYDIHRVARQYETLYQELVQ